MIQREIEKELNKIYREMKSWRVVNKKLNYVIPEKEVRKREELLSLRQILCKVDDAIKEGDKSKEYFNLALYYLTKSAED
jgi:hypothetical protein